MLFTCIAVAALVGVVSVTASDVAIYNVAATNIYNPGAQIVWTTTSPSNSTVWYGTSQGVYTHSSGWYCQGSAGELVTSHCVNLTGLAENTVYYYKVSSGGADGHSAESTEYQFYSGVTYYSSNDSSTGTLGGYASSSYQTGITYPTTTYPTTTYPTSDVSSGAPQNTNTTYYGAGTTEYTQTGTADNIPPTITLNGLAYSKVMRSTPYSDLGAVAIDNVDTMVHLRSAVDGNDVGDPVNISIDTSVLGTHIIRYFATDSSGNRTSMTRTVEVYDPYGAAPHEEYQYQDEGSYETAPQHTTMGTESAPQTFEPYQVSWECYEAGITDKKKCEEHLLLKYMPAPCREKNVTSIEACEKLMIELHMPAECREANIGSEEGCKTYLESVNLPAPCREAGILTAHECERFLFEQHAPPECVAAGVTDERACEDYIFNQNAPDDCVEANVTNHDACRTYMFEKYGNAESIPPEKYPKECVEADVKTIDECEAVMQEKYAPKECRDHGITSGNMCAIYLNEKYMPKECKDANAMSRAECDRVMFEQYAPKECVEAGIHDVAECKEFMIEKYKPRVVCESGRANECDASLRERHIGTIVATQNRFEKVRVETKKLTEGSMGVAELERKLGDAKVVIPLTGTTAKVRLAKAEESIILERDDHLIQTAPAVLMIDSDGDGLTDDFENRLGTDPRDADSDNDGNSDKEEVSIQRNPLGPGMFLGTLAPIDIVTMKNLPLEHPSVAGVMSSHLTVENVTTVANNKKASAPNVEGYIFEGAAEPGSILTLYIYSDMPLVVTVKTDKYGNWQYELTEPLNDGGHEVYVAINDNTGKVVQKSSPLNFFIREAQAFSVDEFVASVSSTPEEVEKQSETAMSGYVIISLMLVFVAAALFISFVIVRNKKPPTPTDPTSSLPT